MGQKGIYWGGNTASSIVIINNHQSGLCEKGEIQASPPGSALVQKQKRHIKKHIQEPPLETHKCIRNVEKPDTTLGPIIVGRGGPPWVGASPWAASKGQIQEPLLVELGQQNRLGSNQWFTPWFKPNVFFLNCFFDCFWRICRRNFPK